MRLKQLLFDLFAPRRSAPPHAAGNALEWESLARELLEQAGCRSLAGIVRVRWNSRMRSTAGTANYSRSLISLNPRLREFGDAEVEATVRHELAHLVAKCRAGKRRIAPHGAEWKTACRDLGIPGEKRCHTLPLPRRKIARRHFYRCGHCQILIPRVRPFRRRVACLPCCREHSGGRYDDRFRLVKVPGVKQP